MAEPRRASFSQNTPGNLLRPDEPFLGKSIEPESTDELLAKLRDLHARTERHDELLGIYELLHENERRFREMIDALPAAIYTTDAEGRLTHFNPAAAKLSGRTPELGTDHWCVTWKLFWPDGTPMRHDECPMAIALKEGRIVEGVETIAERPDGTRFWFMPYPRLLRDADGRVSGGINMLLEITERKQAELTGNLLAAIVGSSDDAIVSKTLDGVVTSWNKSAERLFGYAAEEAIGQHITLIVPHDRLHEEVTIIERLKRGERIDHFETIRKRKDGTLLDVSLTISPVKDSAGRVVGASKVARDITDRKQAERALRESEQRFQVLANSMPQLAWMANGDGYIFWYNERWYEYTGKTPEQMEGWGWQSVHDPAELPRVLDHWRASLRTGETFDMEFPLRRADGEFRWFLTRIVPIRDADGHVVRWFGTNTDVDEARQARETLRESEGRYRALFDLGPIAVYSCDASGVIQNFNRRAVELWGREPKAGDTDERWCGSYKLYLPDGTFLPHELCPMVDVVSGKVPEVRDAEVQIERPDGSRIRVSANIRPLKNARGEIVGVINCFIDITALKQGEKSLREAKNSSEEQVRARTMELEERNAEVVHQSHLLRVLSNRLMQLQDDERRKIARELHDSVGQDLAALSMCLEGAKRVAKATPQTAVQKLEEATTIVEKCSTEIRTLSHLLHPPLLEELGLASAIEWYVEGFGSRSNVQVKLEMTRGLKRLGPSIELPLFRVLQECLTNIHRHSESKTATVKVEADEHGVSLEISDQGKGMALPPRDSKPGTGNRTGVGISGMRERLHELGGTLEIQSTDQGTTVRAVIPLRGEASAASE